MRSPRSSKPSSLNLRWWVGAGVAVVLVLGIGATEYVAAEGTRATQAESSTGLDRYLATLQERAAARQFLLHFGDLLFSANSAALGDSEKGELLRMAGFLHDHPATVAQIVGHADDRGSAAANSRLAGQRADVVRSYLVVQGIDQSRLTAVSGGEERPLWYSSTQSGRAGNRRVEILVQQPELGHSTLLKEKPAQSSGPRGP